jgi:hypothetical protein
LSKLHALLFCGERSLVNVKFVPGNARDLTRDQLAQAGASMIEIACEAWRAGKNSNPPRTKTRKSQLLG